MMITTKSTHKQSTRSIPNESAKERARETENGGKKQYLSSTTKIVVLWFENLCECTAQWLRLRITVFLVCLCICSMFVWICVYLSCVCNAQRGKSLECPDCLCCECSDKYRCMCMRVCVWMWYASNILVVWITALDVCGFYHFNKFFMYALLATVSPSLSKSV